MEAAIHDMARMLEPFFLDHRGLEVEITVVDELDDPWFLEDDGIVTVTDDAHQLDRSLRMRAAVFSVSVC